jgi:DNA-binding transcriptional regulator YhcF (GntR family)
MAIVLDRDSDVPLGTQLAWALRSAIGSAPAGTQLPALRELAGATGVNVNTARVVYTRLAGEGLLQTRQGAGTFVGESSRSFGDASRIAAEAVREARDSGVDPRLVAAHLFVARDDPAGTGSAAERRRALRTQIAGLERALGDLHAAHPDRARTPEAAGRGSAPRLLSERELEQVRARLVRALGATQAAIDETEPPPERVAGATAKPGKSPARTAPGSRRARRVSPATG